MPLPGSKVLEEVESRCLGDLREVTELKTFAALSIKLLPILASSTDYRGQVEHILKATLRLLDGFG